MLMVVGRGEKALVGGQSWWAAVRGGAGGVRYRSDKDIVPRDEVIPDSRAIVRVTASDDDVFHAEVLAFLHALRDEGS